MMKTITRTMDRMLDRLVRAEHAAASCTPSCKPVNWNGQDCDKCVLSDCTVTVVCYPPPRD